MSWSLSLVLRGPNGENLFLCVWFKISQSKRDSVFQLTDWQQSAIDATGLDEKMTKLSQSVIEEPPLKMNVYEEVHEMLTVHLWPLSF